MKIIHLFGILILAVGFFSTPAYGAVAATEATVVQSKKSLKKRERLEKRKEKLADKLQKKWEKKYGEGTGGDFTRDDRFKLGVIFMIAGAAAAIIGINWIGGIAFLVGLVLVLIVFFDY